MKKEPKKFPYVMSIDDLKQTPEAAGGFISVEAAARLLYCTKAELTKLETKGEILGYRLAPPIKADKVGETNKIKDSIFIARDSITAYAERKANADRKDPVAVSV